MAESGSENRQRNVTRTVRLTSMEDAMLRTYADLAGLSVAAYMRMAALKMPPPRTARRPTAAHEDVARLIGHIGDLATAFRGVAGDAETGLIDEAAIDTALRDLSELRLLCFEAMGRKP